jgi:hypothetical protein
VPRVAMPANRATPRDERAPRPNHCITEIPDPTGSEDVKESE